MGSMALFYALAGMVIVSALIVIWSRSPIHSLLALLVAMFGVAALFIGLQAYFLAALQLLIYAGAVLILFLFVLMLLNLDADALARAKQFSARWLAVGLCGLLCVHIVWLISRSRAMETHAPLEGTPGTIEGVGRTLFQEALLPFELTSLLILAAIIGAVALAQRKVQE